MKAKIHGEKAHKKPHLDIGDGHREFGWISLAIENYCQFNDFIIFVASLSVKFQVSLICNIKTSPMHPLNTLIIDDEEHCREALEQLITEDFPEIQLLEICANPKDGINAIKKHDPDLVFLDVEMPGMTGFEMLQQLSEINFDLIFSTAYDKYAVRAFKASALDFLLKPVDKDALTATLAKVRAKQKKQSPLKQLEVLYENIKHSQDAFKKIVIPTITGFEYVHVKDIIRLESDSNYTTLYFNNQTNVFVAKTLKDFEEILGNHHFFRVHNSHLINLRCMKRYVRGEGGTAIMEDGKEVEVSRRRKEEFLKALQAL